MLKKIPFLLTAFTLFSVISQNVQAMSIPPGNITFESSGLVPEGIDFDRQCKCFIVSSAGTGKVGKVPMMADYQEYQLLADDLEMINSIGVYVDSPRNRLLVAISDSGRGPRSTAKTLKKIAKLGIFDLKSGQKKQILDLGILRGGVPHFANDIAVDKVGNIYVTDSMAGIIYKVNKWGTPSIFSQHSFLKIPEGQHGPNGIVYHPNEYLLIANSMTGEVIKISTKNPNKVSKVKLEKKLPPKPDGLEWLSNNGKKDHNQLVVVLNRSAKVYRLSSSDDWLTARIESIAPAQNRMPTTAVSIQGRVYVIHSGFNIKQLQKPHLIEQVLFK